MEATLQQQKPGNHPQTDSAAPKDRARRPVQVLHSARRRSGHSAQNPHVRAERQRARTRPTRFHRADERRGPVPLSDLGTHPPPAKSAQSAPAHQNAHRARTTPANAANQCGDPHLVGWYRRPLLAQLPIYAGVMMRGLLVGVKNPHARFEQEPAQHSLIRAPPESPPQSPPEVPRGRQTATKPHGGRNKIDNEFVASAQVGVAVGVQRHSH